MKTPRIPILCAILMIALRLHPSFGATKTEAAPADIPPSIQAHATMSYGGPIGNYTILHAGDSERIEFYFEITGDLDVNAGDSLEIWESQTLFILSRPVGLDRDKADVYHSTNADAMLDVEFSISELPAPFKRILTPHPICEIKVLSGSLKKGDHIYLSFADPVGSDKRLIVMPKTLGEGVITFNLKRKDDEDSVPITEPIVVVMAAGAPKVLTLIAPSEVGDGESFDLIVKVEDLYGNLADGVTGPVALSLGSKRYMPINFPDPSTPFTRITLNGADLLESISYFKAQLEGSDIEGTSNPIRKVETGAPRIYWGDMHCHAYDAVEVSELVDMTDPHKIYHRAREMNGLDFLAITPHLFANYPDAPEQWWPILRDAFETENIPGAFSTFLGFEWRGDAGDRNVFFPGDAKGPLSPDNTNVFQLFDEAAEAGALANAHYGGAISDVEFEDERVQRLVEVTSLHRHSEFLGHESLALGNKTGFVGSSDDHVGNCGGQGLVLPGNVSFPPDLFYGNVYTRDGIAAVRAVGNTRETIFAALKDRRTYATTGARIILDFDVAGEKMGGETTALDAPAIKLEVYGTAPLQTIAIVRNDDTIFEKHFDAGENSATIEFTDTNPPYGENYYYARITQVNEEQAWTGPVWVMQLEMKNPVPYPIVGAWNYDPIPVSSPDEAWEAEQYLDKIAEILTDIEAERMLVWLEPLKVVRAMDGTYAVFVSYDPLFDTDVRIEYYIDRPYRAIRINGGTLHYGQRE